MHKERRRAASTGTNRPLPSDRCCAQSAAAIRDVGCQGEIYVVHPKAGLTPGGILLVRLKFHAHNTLIQQRFHFRRPKRLTREYTQASYNFLPCSTLPSIKNTQALLTHARSASRLRLQRGYRHALFLEHLQPKSKALKQEETRRRPRAETTTTLREYGPHNSLQQQDTTRPDLLNHAANPTSI